MKLIRRAARLKTLVSSTSRDQSARGRAWRVSSRRAASTPASRKQARKMSPESPPARSR